MRRPIFTEACIPGNGTWLIDRMRSAEGNKDEHWSVKQLHRGRLIVVYESERGPSLTYYDTLKELAFFDSMPMDVLSELRVKTWHYAVVKYFKAYTAKIKRAGCRWILYVDNLALDTVTPEVYAMAYGSASK